MRWIKIPLPHFHWAINTFNKTSPLWTKGVGPLRKKRKRTKETKKGGENAERQVDKA